MMIKIKKKINVCDLAYHVEMMDRGIFPWIDEHDWNGDQEVDGETFFELIKQMADFFNDGIDELDYPVPYDNGRMIRQTDKSSFISEFNEFLEIK